MGVAIPSTHLAPMADGLATLNQLAPGRIDLGVGTGYTARLLLGVPALKLAEIREYLRIVRALLAGEIVDYEFEGAPRKIADLPPWQAERHTPDDSGAEFDQTPWRRTRSNCG
jgi:5,10-methylenetetrahydromethanopterin reductase